MADNITNISLIQKGDYHNPNNIIIEKVTVRENYALHWHGHYELVYILAGTGVHFLNGKEYPIQPGSLHFVTPTDFHALTIDMPLVIIKFIYEGEDIDPFILNSFSGLIPNLDLKLTGEDQKLFEHLFELAAAQSALFMGTPGYHILSKNFLECILLNFMEYCKKTDRFYHQNIPELHSPHQALTYIHQNFRKQLTLQEVALYTHFSSTYLSKMIHQTAGVTFKEYLRQLRLSFASKLLSNTDCPITEVCFESGFGSLSNFINEFKKEYAMSPSAYRKIRQKEATHNPTKLP